MTFLDAALSSLAEGGSKPRLTDFRGGKNAKPLYELSRRCNDLPPRNGAVPLKEDRRQSHEM